MDTFWNDRRIVVTGGAGMIGAPLVRMLVEAGAEVTVLDDFSRGKTEVPGVEYSLRDATSLTVCEQEFAGADGVFNLAAKVAGVAYNQDHNDEMFRENVLLQTVPLVAANGAGVRRVVQVSSACVYAPENMAPAREQRGRIGRPGPSNYGYGMAKRVGEHVAISMGSDTVIVRPFNSYGPGDYYDETAHVIPALIRKSYEGNGRYTVLGTGYEEREFIYCDDVAAGMMAAFQHGHRHSAYNLGTSGATRIPINGLVLKLAWLIWGHTLPKVTYDDSRGGGDSARWSDSTLAAAVLGWEHKIGLDVGIHRTLLDYEQRHDIEPNAYRLAVAETLQ